MAPRHRARRTRSQRILVGTIVLLGLATSARVLPGTVGSPRPLGTEFLAAEAVASSLPSQALYGWGSNDWGQLADGSSGDGAPTPEAVPEQVRAPEGTTFRSVAVGGAHTIGLAADGIVYGWGSGDSGELGLGAEDAATSPQAVAIPDGPILAVAAGSSHSLALTSDGTVYAWGANLFGQLGDGSTAAADVPTPVDLPDGVKITAIAAGGDHSLALSSTGAIYAWGANTYGQLGNGTTQSSDVPVLVPLPGGMTAAAIAAGTGHSLALSTTGQAYGWGFNGSGQLGDGTTTDQLSLSAVAMPDGTRFTSITAGSSHSLALTSTGVVYAWGSDVFGQLDSATVDSDLVDSDVPVQPLGLPPLTTFVAVAAGLNSSYAVTSAGVPWVWGGNAYGQLGIGTPGLDAVLPQALSSLPAGTLITGVFSGPDASTAFVVTRAAQAITYPALPAPTYGDQPVDVAPTADSGLALTNAASGACDGPLTDLHIAAAGTCVLSSTQPGDFWFYPATASASFDISRAVLSVVPDNETATVGVPPDEVGYRITGFVNHDSPSVVSGSALCTSSATEASLAGSYPITCTTGNLSASNYVFAAGNPGVLTLVAAPAGYALVGGDGSVWALGPENKETALLSPFFGSLSGHSLNAPVVGISFTPRHDGYWLVGADGGIFAFGDAAFYGSMGGARLNRPVVGMASTPDGQGYWEVAADGGIFAFGNAGFYGSMGGTALNQPIVGMAATPDGRGYWEVAADGGIFAFGDAAFHGSTGGEDIGPQVIGMSANPSGSGYWLTTSSGAVFAFGRAPFEGSLRYIDLEARVVGITTSYDGRGYWLVSSDGGVFAFGDAAYYGRAMSPPAPIDGIT